MGSLPSKPLLSQKRRLKNNNGNGNSDFYEDGNSRGRASTGSDEFVILKKLFVISEKSSSLRNGEIQSVGNEGCFLPGKGQMTIPQLNSEKQALMITLTRTRMAQQDIDKRIYSANLRKKLEDEFMRIRDLYENDDEAPRNGASFGEIFRLPHFNKLLSAEDIYYLRQVCHEWRQSVDEFLEQGNSIMEELRYSNYKSTLESFAIERRYPMFNPFSGFSVWQSWHHLGFLEEPEENDLGILHLDPSDLDVILPKGNPFNHLAFTISSKTLSAFNAVDVKFVDDVIKAAAAYKDKVTALNFIWMLDLFCSATERNEMEENFSTVELEKNMIFARGFLRTFPRLSTLRIESVEEELGTYFAHMFGISKAGNVYDKQIPDFPPLPNLKTLILAVPNFPMIYPSFWGYFPQLKMLEVTGGFLKWYRLNESAHQRLMMLKRLRITRIYTRFELGGLKKLVNATTLLKDLSIQLKFGMDLYRILALIETGCGDTLQVLSIAGLTLHHVIYQEENPNIAYRRIWRKLIFPNLQVVTLNVQNPSPSTLSLDSLLWIYPGPKVLRIRKYSSIKKTWQKKFYACPPLNDTINEADQIIMFSLADWQLSQSNIWALMPTLEEIHFGKRKFWKDAKGKIHP